MIPLLPVLLLQALLLPAATVLAADLPDGAPPDTDALAAAIRIRGFPCDQPLSPVEDRSDTHPDRPGWIVRCAQGRYLVVYEGDTGPQVTPLD
ncbi:MAG: hypothetical protein HWD60_06335 [Defluviicoccus sp.]|nr:MAG: hypothetical protein HWD60_06335 [Defluviicoccus sp.]